MTPELHLSRVRLRRDAPIAALREVLLPEDADRRLSMAHQLLWTLFADSPARRRDFLWREVELGAYYVLSSRPPHDQHRLFDLDEPKRFAPVLRPGDRLAFALRVNATVARKGEADGRGKPSDIVMDSLHRVPREERAAQRMSVARVAAHAWLLERGPKHGFALRPDLENEREFRLLGYRVLELGRPGRPMRIGVLDLEGILTVRDPDAFVGAVGQGFGRAKAFGCGLMLIRRCHGE